MFHSQSDAYSVPIRDQMRRQRRPASLTLRVIAACLVGVVIAVHYTDYGPLIPAMLSDLHIKDSQAGLMSTLLFLGLAMTYLPGGILVDRYGQRPVLLGATFSIVLGGLLLPLWANIFWMLACQALIGLGSGAAFIAGAGVVASLDKRAALAQGLYGGFIQIGSGLGLLITPLIAERTSWQGAFFFWGLLSIPALLLWLFLRDEQEEPHNPKIDVAAGLRSPAVWSLGLSHMGTFGVGNTIAAWVAVYLASQYSISLEQAATLGAFGLILGAFIRPLGGVLLSRKMLGAVTLLRLSSVATALGVVALALPVRIPVLVAVGMLFIAIGSTLSYTSVYDSAAQLRTVSKGVAQGLVSVLACQALLWGPPLIGFLLQQTGNFSLPFGSILFFCVIAIDASILAGPVIDHERRHPENSKSSV